MANPYLNMSNPYLEGNPYLITKPKSQTGRQVVDLGLKLYSIKNKSGTKTTQYKIGETKPGEPLNVTDPTVETEGLDAFDFGKGGEQTAAPEIATDPELSAFDLGKGDDIATLTPAPEAAEVAAEGEDALQGLDAFDFGADATEGLSAFSFEAAAPELGGAGAGEMATYGLGGTGLSGAGAEAGGATLGSVAGTVGSAATTALPYIALADAGMPVVGRMMEQWTPGKIGGSNVFQKGARITGQNWDRPLEAAHKELFGSELPRWAQTISNPGSYLWRKLGCIIISACTSRDSYEVNIARRFRDQYMDEETLTGYYALCVFVVPFIQKYPLLKRIVKKALVDRLVDYGEWKFDMKPEMKFVTSGVVKKVFLGLCRHIGKGVDTVLAGQEV